MAVWLAAAFAALLATTPLLVAATARLLLVRAGEQRDADAVLVLGAGMSPDGVLAPASLRRVTAGVAALAGGRAPLLVLSGGPVVVGGPSAAARMAAAARAAGVDADRHIAEDRSQSTLQNAAFSRETLDPLGARRVVVVTHGFHLARALLACRWAGFEIAGWAAPDRPASPLMTVREAVSWWVNPLRLAVFYVGGLLRVPRARRLRWLARTPPEGR